MDPLNAGFANKRGFSNFMDPLRSGFYPSKRGFSKFMDPLQSGFGSYKRGFNAFMDPLKSGFGSYKRFHQFMDPLQSGFHVKRDDEWDNNYTTATFDRQYVEILFLSVLDCLIHFTFIKMSFQLIKYSQQDVE